jgi:hypothetical protein
MFNVTGVGVDRTWGSEGPTGGKEVVKEFEEGFTTGFEENVGNTGRSGGIFKSLPQVRT